MRRLKKSPGRFRRAMLEALESRQMLAVDWRNPVDALDINNDRRITAFDALEVITELNLNQPHQLTPPKPVDKPFWDATGNNAISAFDALVLVNRLNQWGAGTYTLAERAGEFAKEQSVTITAGVIPAGSRLYQLKIVPQFDTSDALSASEDTFSVYLVNPLTGQTVLDAGPPGSSLFSLTGTQAAVKNGLVQWDGTFLSIDLSGLNTTETLELRLQLMNVDADSASQVVVTPWTNIVDPGGVPRSPGALRSPPAPPATATNLAGYYQIPGLDVELENVAFSTSTGRFTAEIRLFNDTAVTVTNGVMQLPGLGAGITAVNASGQSSGSPYWNFSSLIGSAGLAPGAKTGWIKVEIDSPTNQLFFWRPLTIGYSSPEHLALSGVFTGTITEAGEQHVFNMPLTAEGRLFTFPLQQPGAGTTRPLTQLLDPVYGEYLYYPPTLDSGFDVYTPYQNGNYQFKLSGRATGPFRIAFLHDKGLNELTLTSERSGFFDPRLGPQVYSFTAKTTQTVLIENRLPSSQLRYGRWQVVDREGFEFPGSFETPSGDYRFESYAGEEYFLVFFPLDYSTTLTPYDFIVRSAVETEQTLDFGIAQEARFESFGHRHAYTFTASANQQVILDIWRLPGDTADYFLIHPLGYEVSIQDSFPVTLDTAGTWQLVVRGNELGSSLFRMHNVADLPPLPSGVTMSASVNTLKSDFYRIPAVRGERLELINNLPGAVLYSLIGPASQYLEFESSTGLWKVPETGDIILSVFTFDGTHTNLPYSFTLHRSIEGSIAQVGLDVDHTGVLATGTTTIGTFTASAGTQIMVDKFAIVGDTSGFSISLTGPGLDASFTKDSGVLTLVRSGTYTIRANNPTAGAIPYGLRIINLTAAPLLSNGDSINVTLKGGSTYVRRVEGRIRDQILLSTMGAELMPAVTIQLKTDSSAVTTWFSNAQLERYDFATEKTHFLTIEQDTASDTPLALQALVMRDSEVLPIGTTFSGTIAPGGSKLYQFSTQKYENLYFDTLAMNASGSVKAQVFDNALQELSTTQPTVWGNREGIHYVWIHAEQATPLNFTISARFLPIATTPLALNTVISGTLAVGEPQLFRFETEPGQVFFFDGLDETSPSAPLAIWGGLDGTYGFSQTTADNWFFKVNWGGVYTLAVGESASPYSFRVLDVANVPDFPLDTNVLGSIAADEQARIWRFPTANQQTIFVDSNASAVMPFLGTMSLHSSAGSLYRTTSATINNDIGSTFLLGGGLLVINAGAAPFDYDLRIRTSQKTILPISIGTTVTGSLRDPGDSVEYTFTAAKGQHIHLEGITNVTWRIVDPDGNVLPTTEGFTYLLKNGGEYRVRVSASSTQVEFPYRFQLVDVSTVPLLPLNTPISGSTTEGRWLLHRLVATAGSRFTFDSQSFSGPTINNSWRLVSPEATFVFVSPFIDGDQTITVPETGEYLFVVRLPGGAIDYAFQVNTVAQTPVTVAGLDQTYSGSVVLEERVNLQFTGNAGQRVFLDVLDGGSLPPVTRLLGPDASVVDAAVSTDRMFVLPLSGTYTLELYANGSATPRNYNLRLLDASIRPVTPLDAPFAINFNQTFQAEVWAFNAAAGDQLGFELGLIPLNASFRVIQPDGKSFSLASTPDLVTMSQTGRHYLVMDGQSQATPVVSTGQIWNTSNLPLITNEDPIVVNFAGREWHLYSFDLAANERVLFTPATALPTGLQVVFKGPRNQSIPITIDNLTNPTVFTVTRPGRHTLLVARTTATPVQFTFQIHKAIIRETFGIPRN